MHKWYVLSIRFNFHLLKVNFQDAGKIKSYKSLLLVQSRQMRFLLCSSSPTTVSLLCSMLDGLDITLHKNITDTEIALRQNHTSDRPFTVLILDDQSEDHAAYLICVIESLAPGHQPRTALIHLYTFTKGSVVGRNPTPLKLSKPVRTLKLLQMLVEVSQQSLPNIPLPVIHKSPSTRLLYGKVLIAEGEVSRTLLYD